MNDDELSANEVAQHTLTLAVSVDQQRQRLLHQLSTLVHKQVNEQRVDILHAILFVANSLPQRGST